MARKRNRAVAYELKWAWNLRKNLRWMGYEITRAQALMVARAYPGEGEKEFRAMDDVSLNPRNCLMTLRRIQMGSILGACTMVFNPLTGGWNTLEELQNTDVSITTY